MAKPELSGTKAGWFLSVSLNKCGKNRNKCKLFLVIVFLAYGKKKHHEKKSFSLAKLYYKYEENLLS